MLLAFAGCSSTRLAYNSLDWIISWRLDDYIQMNDGQDDRLEDRLKALLRWHRKEELPRYAAFVERLQEDVKGPVTSAQLERHLETLWGFWRETMGRAGSEAAELLLSLDSGQRQALFENISKKEARLKKKYRNLSAEQRGQQRCKRTKKILKRFFGSLRRDQQEALQGWSRDLVPLGRMWLESRQAWQARLRQVLDGSGEEDSRRKLLRRLLVEPDSFWPDDYRKAIEHNQRTTLAMLVFMLERLDEKQKRRLQETLEGFKRDFIHLSKN